MASVLLCSDEPILSEGMRRILSDAVGLEFHAYCSGLSELKAELERHRPNLVLVDLPADITFDALSSLQDTASDAKLVLWVHTISTELALQAMSLGVRGILRKSLPVETLLRCLSKVNEGELWFEKSLMESIMTARRYTLTRREGELVSLLSQGLKNREIATALTISEGTVKVYLSRLFQKLGVKDRFELALYGLKNLNPGAGTLDALNGSDPRSKSSSWQPPRSFFVERLPGRSPESAQ